MFRRSGSFVAFFVDGRMPDPRSAAFTEALAGQRFRSIESAASEEVSIGWVTSGDPTGDSFELEDIDLDRGLWLQVRTDKKKLPAVWVRIRRAQAERSAGRKLSARERKELKEALMDELLPRILPSVGLTDVLFEPKSGLLLLFGTSTALKDEFQKLWFRTFACNLVECEPHSLAQRSGLDRDALGYLDEVAPVRWSDDPAQAAPAAPRKLVVAEQARAPLDHDDPSDDDDDHGDHEFGAGTEAEAMA